MAEDTEDSASPYVQDPINAIWQTFLTFTADWRTIWTTDGVENTLLL